MDNDLSDRYEEHRLGDAFLIRCRDCRALVFDVDAHEAWHVRRGDLNDGQVSSGQAAPPSHHGTCAECHESVIWCMAGYWVHERDGANHPAQIDG